MEESMDAKIVYEDRFGAIIDYPSTDRIGMRDDALAWLNS